MLGCVIVDDEGETLRTTMNAEDTERHVANLPNLAEMARSMVRDLDPLNDLEFLRVRTKNHEIMVSSNAEFTLIVIQDPHYEEFK